LEVARSDTLHLQVFGRIPGEFENLGCEIFEDGGDIDGGW